MFEVNEPIQVAMLFKNGEVQPVAFLWNGYRYEITAVTIIHKTRIGDVLRWHFGVQTKGGGVARLAFDTLSLNWTIENIEQ